jgi:hypothetical protein
MPFVVMRWRIVAMSEGLRACGVSGGTLCDRRCRRAALHGSVHYFDVAQREGNVGVGVTR